MHSTLILTSLQKSSRTPNSPVFLLNEGTNPGCSLAFAKSQLREAAPPNRESAGENGQQCHLIEGIHGQKHHPGHIQSFDDLVGHGGLP